MGESKTPTLEEAKLAEAQALLNRARVGKGISAFAVYAVLLNMLILLTRPQNDIPVLALIQFPFILSLWSFCVWLPKCTRGWSTQTRLMLAIVIFGGIWVPFALNNRWAFEGFRVLAQLFIMVLFPLAAFFRGSKWLEKLFRLFCFTGFYLAFYGVTHSGHGPGDYLGDENDLCLALVFHLGLLLGLLGVPTSAARRTIILLIVGLILGAIVITNSRGGFLGMITVSVFHIMHARRRVGFFILALVLAAFTMLLAPASYWERIRTISDTDTGSAKERRETWNFAWDLFTRKDVMLLGVGMKNTPVYLGDYKTTESRNLWGRQTHSLYFELLPDLGLLGAGLSFAILWASFVRNRRLTKRTVTAIKEVRSIGALGSAELRTLRRELIFLRSCLISLNAAWAGVLVSGAFISIYYYPPLWILATLSAAVQAYGETVMAASEPLLPKQVRRKGLPRPSDIPALSY